MEKERKRPVILLCFGYHRQAWIRIFEDLKDDFEFHYLYYVYPTQETVSFTECPRHYWSAFRNAQQLLDKIRPVKVIMMETGSLPHLALLFSCRRRKITTYVMQHGVLHDMETYITLHRQLVKNRLSPGEIRVDAFDTRRETLPFFFSSLRPGDLFNFFRIARWQVKRRKMLDQEAARLNKHPYQQADYYIVYTKFNGHYFTESGGVKPDKMLEIGVPDFDPFFNYTGSEDQEATVSYNLVIDSALTYNREFQSHGVISQESYNSFIQQLNEISLATGRRLYVKLHPYSYDNDAFYQDENITYYKDANAVGLVMGAGSVIGFNSTLMLPALYFKPTIVFTLDEQSYLPRVFRQHGIGTVLEYFNFNSAEILMGMDRQPSREVRQALENLFLYRSDGKTTDRLRDILSKE